MPKLKPKLGANGEMWVLVGVTMDRVLEQGNIARPKKLDRNQQKKKKKKKKLKKRIGAKWRQARKKTAEAKIDLMTENRKSTSQLSR